MRLHGHRGARGHWPENTLLGIKNTFDLGVRVVELDVLLSQDNVPVVTHNPTLMTATTRAQTGGWITDDSLKIIDIPYCALKQYDVGGIRAGTAYAARYPDQAFLFDLNIPTLEDVAVLVQADTYKDVWLNIEIKSTPLDAGLTPAPDLLAKHVVDLLVKKRLQERVILQSFDWRVLREIKALAPDIPRSHLTYQNCKAPVMQPNIYADSPWMDGTACRADFSDLSSVIAGLGGAIWSPFHENITQDAVQEAQELGLIVNAWTVNDVADIDRMLTIGVDGIITDYPGRVQRRMIERGIGWHEDLAVPA